VEQGFVQLRFGSSDQSCLDAADSVVAEVLDHLSIEAEKAEDLGDNTCVQVQTVGGEQETLREASSLQTLLQVAMDIPCSATTYRH
jgi:hypothetical protein